MTSRKKENRTLSFEKPNGSGSALETFFPWNLTIDRFLQEGLPMAYATNKIFKPSHDKVHNYHYTLMADGCHAFETYLGFDSVKRFGFYIPFNCFDVKILDETDEFILRRDTDGWERKYFKNSNMIQEVTPVVKSKQDWDLLKQKILIEIEKYFTDEIFKEIYTPYRNGHIKGDYSIRYRIDGFFWKPRQLFGIEEHMMAFYDFPDLIHEINEFMLNTYIRYLDKLFDIICPDVLLICEDLSGANGPMLSPSQFNEFVGAYYKRLIPFLKDKGVKNVFVDTDGDFTMLIPNFMESGVDGFIPLDVNAGVDIVKVRTDYPRLKFIGGFNKLAIAKGKEAIDKEFQRLMPVIRQGGYIPGCDHQVAPSTSLENYQYYIMKLKEAMKEAGADL